MRGSIDEGNRGTWEDKQAALGKCFFRFAFLCTNIRQIALWERGRCMNLPPTTGCQLVNKYIVRLCAVCWCVCCQSQSKQSHSAVTLVYVDLKNWLQSDDSDYVKSESKTFHYFFVKGQVQCHYQNTDNPFTKQNIWQNKNIQLLKWLHTVASFLKSKSIGNACTMWMNITFFFSFTQYCNIVGFALYLVCFTNTYGHK